MSTNVLIGILGAIVIILLPLLNKQKRTKEEIRKVIINIIIIMGLFAIILFLNVNPLLAAIIGVVLFILIDKKTYTKKRLVIYTLIILAIGVTSFIIFRDNPDYIVDYLQENPETTSFYLAENGEQMITYQSDVVRPLASTVKILIAIEYAMQVDSGELDQEAIVPIDNLNLYYWGNTDGGAHEQWLNDMKTGDKSKNNEVKLRDVAKGMIEYSSNANTDYLMKVLGISNIDKRAESLGLNEHETMYPIVSALFIPKYLENDFKNEKKLLNYLTAMSRPDYDSLAKKLNQDIETGNIDLNNQEFDVSMDLQKVWSDRLIGSSANDYGKLLSIISNDELPGEANKVVRDLLEWPMEYNEENKKYYSHLGSKGGSTAFVMNDALYAETIDNDKIELVLLTDELSFLKSIFINLNLNSFEAKLVSDEDYRSKVQKELEN